MSDGPVYLVADTIKTQGDKIVTEIERLANILEAFATTYAAVNHAEDVYADVRDRQQR